MFKITPINDKNLQMEVCNLCGAIFRPEAFAYLMYDIESGKVMGMTQFDIGKEGIIYDIKEVPGRNDFEAMFILARQTMNFIDQSGAHICKAEKTCAPEVFLIAIGFKETSEEYVCNMNRMFDGNCSGHK